MKKLVLLAVVLLSAINNYAQNSHLIDSLLQEIDKYDHGKNQAPVEAFSLRDSVKVKLMDDISWEYFEHNNDSGQIYARRLLTLSEKIAYKKGIGLAYHSMGAFASNSGKYAEALKNIPKALAIWLEIKDTALILSAYRNLAITYINTGKYDSALSNYNTELNIESESGNKKRMGETYEAMGDINHSYTDHYDTALVYYLKALQIYQNTADKNGEASVENKIGFNYWSLGVYTEALKHALVSLKLYESLGDKNGAAMTYELLGMIDDAVKNYSDAIKNLQTALKIDSQQGLHNLVADAGYSWMGQVYYDEGNNNEALKWELIARNATRQARDVQWLGITYINLGHIYEALGNYNEALDNYEQAIQLYAPTPGKHGSARSQIGLGRVYEKLGKLQDALRAETKGLELAKALEAEENIKDAYQELAIINAKLRDYKAAYADEQLYKQYYDTIFNKENEKKLTSLELNYEFDRRQDSVKEEQLKKDAIATQQLQKQKIFTGAGVGGLMLVILLLFFVYRNYINQRKATAEITIARHRSESLLLNILPAEVAEELKENGKARARLFDEVTILFTDFTDFTKVSMRLTPQQLVDELHACFKAFDEITGKYNIEKIKTVGDAYLAAAGLPEPNANHAADIVNAAIEIREFIAARIAEGEMKRQSSAGDAVGFGAFEVRIGIHTGSVVAGIVGIKKFAYDIWGDTVNTAARMEQNSTAGKINISETTYELVKDKFDCEYRGEVEAKNKGLMKMYFVN